MKTQRRPFSTHLKLIIVVIWALLFVLLLRRDVFIKAVDYREIQTLQQAKLEEYLSIFFREQKIGYVIYRYTPSTGGNWLLEQTARMNLNVAGQVQVITMELEADMSAQNILQKFDFTFQSPFYTMEAHGSVNGNSVSYQLQTGTNTVSDTFVFNRPPMLATSRRAYLLQEGIKEGDKRKIPWFDPVSMTGKESVIEYRGKESVLIGGRVHKLHRFIESFSGARVNSWLNDSGVVIKEESPAGFVFLKEPKFKAMSLNEAGEEILSAVAVKVKGQMVDGEHDQLSYRLTMPDDSQFDLDGGRQRYVDGVLTVSLEQINNNTMPPVQCAKNDDALSASPYVQADHEKIRALAEELTDTLTQPADKITVLAQWVYENIDKRPVLGLPDALTTLSNRQGDCNEHAALFAALARAAGIPTQIVAGVTYHQDAFYYHAWNEVCLNDSWISIDTTTNQFPADLSHIRFIYGEMQEQVRIGGLLGALTIEPLPGKNKQ